MTKLIEKQLLGGRTEYFLETKLSDKIIKDTQQFWMSLDVINFFEKLDCYKLKINGRIFDIYDIQYIKYWISTNDSNSTSNVV